MSAPAATSAIAFAPVRPDLRLDIYRGEEWINAFARDAKLGLCSEPRVMSPKYFYDATGSELFDAICELPEYYPTRTEAAIIERYGREIIEHAAPTALVELGSGSSEKTEHLLGPLLEIDHNALYVPVDFSESAVREASVRLIAEYPGLRVHGVIGDFERHLGGIPEADARLFAFLGSTIGNFTPQRMHHFLTRLRLSMQRCDWLLIGIDLVKDSAEVEAAYNDSAGVTARFNKNMLAAINRDLGGTFDLDLWQHVAFFDPENSWVEMRLRAKRRQLVDITAIDVTIEFDAGDEIRTEISRKFKREGFADELRAAGFELDHWYSDSDRRFALVLAHPGDDGQSIEL